MRTGKGNRSTLEKSYSNIILPATNPTWSDLGSNRGGRGGNPATSRLSYGTAAIWICPDLRDGLIPSRRMQWCCLKAHLISFLLQCFRVVLSNILRHKATSELSEVLCYRCAYVCSFMASVRTGMLLLKQRYIPQKLYSTGFWRWCIAHKITGFSDFVHRPDSKQLKEKTRRFGNWICFRPQVRERHLLDHSDWG
jgi:hypothetical protein